MGKRSGMPIVIIAAVGFFLALTLGVLFLLAQLGIHLSLLSALYQLVSPLSFASDGAPWGLIPLALTLAGVSGMLLALRNGNRRFYVLLPLVILMSYTLYTLSHLVTFSVKPALGAWLLERSNDIRAASLKVVILFMIQMVLFVAVVLLSDALAYIKLAHRRRQRRKERAKLAKEQAVSAAPTAKEIRKAKRKERRVLKRQKKDAAIAETQEAAPESEDILSPFEVVEIPELESFEKRPKSVQMDSGTNGTPQPKTSRTKSQSMGVVSAGALQALNAERVRSKRGSDSTPAPAAPVATEQKEGEELSGFLVGALEAIGRPTTAKKRRKGAMKLPQGRARGILAEAVEREELTRDQKPSTTDFFATPKERSTSVESAQDSPVDRSVPGSEEMPTLVEPAVDSTLNPAASVEPPSVATKTTVVEPIVEAVQAPAVPPRSVKPISAATETITEEVSAEDDTEESFEAEFEASSGVGGLVKGEGQSALLNQGRIRYQFPSEAMLETYDKIGDVVDEATRARGELLIETLAEFNIAAELKAIVRGPTVTMFELLPTAGVRVNAIANLSDNIALALAATQVRIVAPIPGKSAVGVEIPNVQRDIIGFREMLGFISAKFRVPMILGRDLLNRGIAIDVMESPHLLIAGSTGSGKSVCINSLICSILFTRSPREVRLILVDPKIVELNIYNGIPHLLTPVITDPKRTLKALDFALYEMERRYRLLQSISVRNIVGYNERIKEQRIAREQLPYIVIIIDEFADLMHLVGKEMEMRVSRLAAMSRAVGIHLVLATQRPSVDVITGVIKNNIPTRIAFAVTSSTNSRIILDEMGAEQLLGRGDMLYQSATEPTSTRIQGSFLSDREVEEIVNFVRRQGEPDYIDESFFEEQPEPEESESSGDDVDLSDDEVLFEEALAIVVERNGASASFLQRRLRIGYNRAARLVEQMEEMGIVGPPNGSKPRELLRIP